MKETFGQRLQNLRRERNFTQEDIASKVHVSAQAVSKWENDIASPDINTLIALSDILSVSLDELMGKEKKEETVLVEESKRKDINSMVLKIRVEEKGSGDKVNINIPVALIQVFLNNGTEIPLKVGNSDSLKDIDFNQILELVKQGVIGELVNIESGDGDIVRITVE